MQKTAEREAPGGLGKKDQSLERRGKHIENSDGGLVSPHTLLPVQYCSLGRTTPTHNQQLIC